MAINTSRDDFSAIVSNPKNLTEDRFEQLELDGRPLQIFPYPTVTEVSEKEDALIYFDSIYDPNTSTK